MNRVIYACDIGSIKRNNFAWARLVPSPAQSLNVSNSIDELVASLINDAKRGLNIALGFESPLFLPVPDASGFLGKGRGNEANRAVFASIGAAVTTLGIHEAAWILRTIHSKVSDRLKYTINPTDWYPLKSRSQILFIWEAFVSGDAHSEKGDDEHCRDAATAVDYFMKIEDRLQANCNITATCPINLIHSVALWAKWSSDIQGLHQECLVVQPTQPYMGKLPSYNPKEA